MRPRPERARVVVCDLDDTLYYEADYARGGIRAACAALRARGLHYAPARAWQHLRAGRPPLDAICAEEPAAAAHRGAMLAAYRAHRPRLTPRPGALALLARCRAAGAGLALITDGRGACQRRKLAALDLAGAFDLVLVSEELGADKRAPAATAAILRTLPARAYLAIGDNPAKDFVQPRRRGWRCLCLRDDGRHVHPQPARLPAGIEPLVHLDAALAG